MNKKIALLSGLISLVVQPSQANMLGQIGKTLLTYKKTILVGSLTIASLKTFDDYLYSKIMKESEKEICCMNNHNSIKRAQENRNHTIQELRALKREVSFKEGLLEGYNDALQRHENGKKYFIKELKKQKLTQLCTELYITTKNNIKNILGQ